MRAINTLLSLSQIFTNDQWQGPYFDFVFLLIFNFICNYGLGTAVTIPISTNISSEYVYSKKNKNKKTTELLWVSGNDKISNNEEITINLRFKNEIFQNITDILV